MTSEIKNYIKSQGHLVCPSCDGEGEVGYFCGHESTTRCSDCMGRGILKSLKKQKQSKECSICRGKKGGCGGCNFSANGSHEWESYELI